MYVNTFANLVSLSQRILGAFMGATIAMWPIKKNVVCLCAHLEPSMPPFDLIICSRFIEADAIMDVPTLNRKDSRSSGVFRIPYSKVVPAKKVKCTKYSRPNRFFFQMAIPIDFGCELCERKKQGKKVCKITATLCQITLFEETL